MKQFVKDFSCFFLFVITQSILIFADYVYINLNEPLNIHFNLLLITLIITMLSLSIRSIFEALLIAISTRIFKNILTLRDVVKTMFQSMKIPIILAILFSIFQVIIIKSSDEIYQIIALTVINLSYMLISSIKFRNQKKNNVASITFLIYSIIYIIMQIHSIYSLL